MQSTLFLRNGGRVCSDRSLCWHPRKWSQKCQEWNFSYQQFETTIPLTTWWGYSSKKVLKGKLEIQSTTFINHKWRPQFYHSVVRQVERWSVLNQCAAAFERVNICWRRCCCNARLPHVFRFLAVLFPYLISWATNSDSGGQTCS